MLQSNELPSILSGVGINLNNNLIKLLNWKEDKLPAWRFSTDSRNIPRGAWFIALRGENFDGHKFCQQTIESGATGLIISDVSLTDDFTDVPVVLVKNTLEAYQAIARAHRHSLKTKVVAITGSNGKTTTKEMLFNVLSQKYKTKASNSNENNEIGVPKNLLQLDENDEIMISECGMRGLGQIEELTKITEPDYTIITNIGTAHIGILGSRENIAKAKSEIFCFQPSGGIALVPFNEPLLKPFIEDHAKWINFIKFGNFTNAKFEAKDQGSFNENGTRFYYRGETFYLQTASLGLVSNACAVIDLALHLGLKAAEIQTGLDEFKPLTGRGALTKLKLNEKTGATLIDESYNANPDSVRELAKSLKRLSSGKTTILVLGEMAELGDLGESLLSGLAKDLNQNVDELFLVGTKCFNSGFTRQLTIPFQIFQNKEEVFEYFTNEKSYLLDSKKVIAVKASRSAKLNELVKNISSIE
ncbi:MAG: UDP-N-acetylmuramoyl-tripeptide--D-alanyl-D-alanine ligase [Candidatus Caenarcaniphilales bacterium]|nr:UDP-N-acetylmuramoyl-tripeptide--D-alanyl-D-alanine ligase [Candidatus Caenarcaniphilales bacterium]